MARIRTSDRAPSRGGTTLVAVPPWQKSARPRTSPPARWLSSVGTALGRCVMQLFSTLFAGLRGGSGVRLPGAHRMVAGSGGPAPAAERGPRPVTDVAGPEQGTADRAGTVAPFEALPPAPEHAGAQRQEDGQDQPHAQPAGEEEPHEDGLPSSRVDHSSLSRTTIFPVLPPRRRSRNAGTASSSPSRTVSRTTRSPEVTSSVTRAMNSGCRSAWSLTMKPRRLSFLVTSMNMLRGPGCGSTAL